MNVVAQAVEFTKLQSLLAALLLRLVKHGFNTLLADSNQYSVFYTPATPRRVEFTKLQSLLAALLTLAGASAT